MSGLMAPRGTPPWAAGKEQADRQDERSTAPNPLSRPEGAPSDISAAISPPRTGVGASVISIPTTDTTVSSRRLGTLHLPSERDGEVLVSLWERVGRREPPQAALVHARLAARLTAEAPLASPSRLDAPHLHLVPSSPPQVSPLFGALPQGRNADPEPVPDWDNNLVARIQRALAAAGFIDKATGELRELTTAEDGIALSDLLTRLAEADLGGLYV